MKLLSIVALFIIILATSLSAFASSDGIYNLVESTAPWDGSDANLLETPADDYDFVYSDDATVSYKLPWSFTFYGQQYLQITADTNGNIWFGSDGSAYSFNLAANGKGPVIAVWNNDLSSYLSGGVFIRHKSNPERVVVEWLTESYSEEGLTTEPNNIEVVLYQTGAIRVAYQSFTAAAPKDFGSGISNNENRSLSITSAFFPVYLLSGKSYDFTKTISSLQVRFSGSGSGSVTSDPAGIACNTDCSADFTTGGQITLHPATDQYSLFGGWSNNSCAGLGDCLLTLAGDTSITADFARDSARQVYLPDGTPQYYSTIQAAYGNATSSSVIKVWATDYSEVINFNSGIDVQLQGGYDGEYANQIGTTVITGALKISQGKVSVSGVAVK